MANHGAAPVTATQIGSYFVQQYYQVFKQQRDYMHQFYTDESSMIRVDGEISHSASDMMQIHHLIMSLDFTGIEIKTINSLESWNGGVLVVVSGSAKSRDVVGWKKFVQTFFLAPQEKGYFVLNDMFHLGDEEVVNQPLAPTLQEDLVDYQPTISSHVPNPPASNYALEETAREYVDSVHIEEDEPDQEYSYQEQEHYHQEPKPEPEPEPDTDTDTLEEEIPVEESDVFHHNVVTTVPDAQLPADDESVGEPEKLTYASILRAKGKSSASISYPPAFAQSAPTPAPAPAPHVSDWNYVAMPFAQSAPTPTPAPHVSDWNYVAMPLQQSNSSILNSGLDVTEETLSQDEGESKSVYVRNLSSTVTTLDILQEFKNFGKIKNDGIFLRNRKDTGVCYAFVEFEDVQGVHNAIKASPVLLAGRQVYIEERRPNAAGASRGGRGGRGRGRGGFGGRSYGRGSDQNGSDNFRVRSNGFRGN